MKFENVKVMNFEGALRGMRNPKNSWDKSDSIFGLIDSNLLNSLIENQTEKWLNSKHINDYEEKFLMYSEQIQNWFNQNGIINSNLDNTITEIALIGPNDMKLAKTLIRAGSEHRKFMRQIFVSVDITAPLYW